MAGRAGEGRAFQGTERFRILSRLGEGGMGVVYTALDVEHNRRVALKTMRHLSGQALLSFKTEFRALQDLDHPNLISLGELISDGDDWFITMELVAGVDFRAWVRGTEDGPDDVTPSLVRAAATAGPPVAADTVPDGSAPPPGFDEVRLRAALGQLGSGLHALHAAGKVHRDIKPPNILVTFEGRVVILDFGLVVEAAGPREWSDTRAVGTADYMAPEQAASKPVGPEADWYSVGVMLYEVLTGQLPFSGPPLAVLVDKQQREPAAPRTLCPSLPEDLDRLCVDLLRFDPKARPNDLEVLARLGVGQPTSRSSVSQPSATVPFVGRRHELDQIAAAFAETRRGTPVAFFVRGESGIGKSALVRRFLDEVKLAHPDAVVLAGRCYERESVPYKAVDGVIDALARLLKRAPTASVEALIPRHAGLLAQVFPVLRRVEAIARAPLDDTSRMSPQEQRARVFSTMRELIDRVTVRQPVVVAIDDLQWSDADSRALIGATLRPPDAPRVMLLATVRSNDPATGGAPIDLAAIAGGAQAHYLDLARLAPGEAREMASLLLGEGALAASLGRADSIAEEAGGHPLYIDELVRHLVAGHEAGPTALEDALWSRVARLDDATRLLCELVAVAGRPLPQAVLAHASGETEFGAFVRRASLLRVAHLVRTNGARATDGIEPYHDRVREAVLWHLDEDTRQRRHASLALALEAIAPNESEALALHWTGAGHPQKAYRHAVAASRQAQVALAFDRAARLLELAIASTRDEAAQRSLRIELGDALSHAGIGRDAARAYLAAATGATRTEELELRRRAAGELLRDGHIDEGVAVLRSVLHAAGLKLPTGRKQLIAAILFRRSQLKVRGLRYRRRDASQVTPERLSRIDICWSLAIGFGMSDHLLGSYFQTRGLLLALQAGEPVRLARSLLLEAAYSGTDGAAGQPRQKRLLAVAQPLVDDGDDPVVKAWSVAAPGIAAFLAGDWRRGYTLCDQAARTYREKCPGADWEARTLGVYALLALTYLGEAAELARLVPLAIHEAQTRGDLAGASTLRTGVCSLAWLVPDRPAEARREISDAGRSFSRRGYFMPHFWMMLSLSNLDLYEGQPESAYRRIRDGRAQLEDSLILRTEILRHEALGLRARATLAFATRTGDAVVMKEAEKDCERIEREAVHWSLPIAMTVRAGMAFAAGDATRSAQLLREALARFDAAGMMLHAAVARLRLGEILGGAEGRPYAEAAAAWMAKQTIKNPRRMAEMLAPGFRAAE